MPAGASAERPLPAYLPRAVSSNAMCRRCDAPYHASITLLYRSMPCSHRARPTRQKLSSLVESGGVI